MDSPKISTSYTIFLLAGVIALYLFSGQTPISGDPTVALFKKGKKLWTVGQADSAYVIFRQVQAQAKNKSNRELWAQAMQLSGIYLSRQMQMDAATATLDSVIALSGEFAPLTPLILFARKERAYVDLMKNDIPSALHRYQQLAADCEKLPQTADSIRATVFEGLGQALYYNGEYQQGLIQVEKALNLYYHSNKQDTMPIAICYNTLAIMQMYLSQYEQSLDNYLFSLKLLSEKLGENHPNVLQVKTNIGVLYGELGLFWKSLEYHRQVLPHLEKLPPSAHLNGLLNMGSTLITVGDYEAALDYFDQAEIWLRQFPGMTPENEAYIELNRSIIYKEINEEERSLKSIGRSIQINEKIFGKNHPGLITDYIQQGNLFLAVGKYDSAIFAYKNVYHLASKHEGENALRKGHALYFLAETYAQKGETARAVNFYHQAENAYVANGNRFEQTKTLVRIAEIWRDQNSRDSAMAYHRRAWELSLPEIPFSYSPGGDVLTHWKDQSLSYLLAAQAQSLLHFSQFDQNQVWLEAALAATEAAFMAGDSQRHYYEAPGSGPYNVRDQLPVFEDALSAAWLLYQLSGDHMYAEKAWKIADKSKAGILKDHLRGIQALHFAGVPDSVIEQEQYFRQRLATLDAAMYDPHADSLQVSGFQAQRFRINQSYRLFLRNLEQQFPDYYQLKFAEETVSATDLSAQLMASQAAYSYFLGEHYLFVFRLFRGEILFYRIEKNTEITDDLSQWLDFISQPPQADTTQIEKAGRVSLRLTQTLLPQLSPDITQLLIIPDGILGYLSFESLLTEQPPSSDFRTWSFLAQQQSVNYAYAGELWLQSQKKHSGQNTSARYLGFAPGFSQSPASETRGSFSPLTHNREEVNQVAKLLRGNAFTGAEAKEIEVKNLGTQPVILHFATHAIADEQDLMASRLFFEQDTTDKEDGILHAYEIYGLTLNSPLTVLSACQTGKGPIRQGEGLMSLARAFQFGGSRNILSTLWQTDDQAGATLTTDFFRFLVSGDDTESALQHARKSWLTKSDSYHCHPYFWAGYVLVGDGRGVTFKKSGRVGEIGLGVLSVIILGLLGIGLRKMWRKRKIQRV